MLLEMSYRLIKVFSFYLIQFFFTDSATLLLFAFLRLRPTHLSGRTFFSPFECILYAFYYALWQLSNNLIDGWYESHYSKAHGIFFLLFLYCIIQVYYKSFSYTLLYTGYACNIPKHTRIDTILLCL